MAFSSELTLKKINDIAVKPVIQNQLAKEEILGYDYFPNLYSNIYICSKRKSGKTTLIYNILKHCTDKRTNVVFFCSTIHRDATYGKILEMLEKKGVNVLAYSHFIEGKENVLQSILTELDGDLEAKETAKKPKGEEQIGWGKFDKEEEKKEVVEKKPKKLGCEYIFIFDDLGSDLRHPSITQLCKVSRHYKAKLIFSSQYLHDLQNAAIKNIDVCLIFKSFNTEKLLVLYEGLDLTCTFETFLDMYHEATKDNFNFLYVDCREGTFRKNFNQQYVLRDTD